MKTDSKVPIHLIFYSGPSHGWLRVPKAIALEYHRCPGRNISAFSYFDEDYIYFEEDCDAPRFLDWIQTTDKKYELLTNNIEDESFIRNKEGT